MRQTLNVNIKNDSMKEYDIHISDESFEKLLDEISSLTENKKRLFVVSKKVYKLYGKILNLPEEEIFIVNDGEKEKCFKTYQRILEHIVGLNFTRNDVLIALGGGVIGDLTGFVASTYMRGIDYIQVPTTLLAMVDSSVGGKTAIDLNGVKNIVGSFYQPKAVFININFLKTLDNKQFKSGLGEILKYAFIEDNCGYKHSLFLFEYLTLSCEKFLEMEAMTLMRVIEYCLNLKISVVVQDEKEGGLRKVLNLGHTLAHALEAKTKYKKFTHGEAVVSGMFFVFNWAYSENMISYSYYRLATELLSKYGFKGSEVWKKYPTFDLIEIMKKDKKALSDRITFIVPCEKKKVKEIKLTAEEVLKMF